MFRTGMMTLISGVAMRGSGNELINLARAVPAGIFQLQSFFRDRNELRSEGLQIGIHNQVSPRSTCESIGADTPVRLARSRSE